MSKRDRDILKPLTDQLAQLASLPREAQKKELWARHQALLPTAKIPVSVTYEGIPPKEWEGILGQGAPQCEDSLARDLESALRQRLWAAAHIPDDHIVWPALTIPAVLRAEMDWGVPLAWRSSGEELGAKSIVAPFAGGIDLARIRFRDQEIDDPATRRRAQMAADLVEGRLGVFTSCPHLGFSPLETAVMMCGIEGLMLQVVDFPEKVDALMRLLTDAYLSHHQRRERDGHLNVFPMDGGKYLMPGIWRVHSWHAVRRECAFRPALADEWAYVSAQSAAGLGPEMYERFVHPHNRRLAELFTNETVYYHGCERLDHKLDILATLPHLRRFHVSPWSSVAAARDKFRGKVVMEVHAHPGKVFFTSTPADMRREIRSLIDAAEGAPLDLNLSDINTVNSRPETLTEWARIAQEESSRR